MKKCMCIMIAMLMTIAVSEATFSADKSLKSSVKVIATKNVPNKPIIYPQLGNSSAVKFVTFSPDSKYALSGTMNNILKLWDVASGREIRTFIGDSTSNSSISFSPDGRYILTVSGGSTMKLWDVASGREIRIFTGHLKSINCVSFSHNGRYILSGSDDATVKLWDVESGLNIRTFTGQIVISAISFSADDRFVISFGKNKMLIAWDIINGHEVSKIEDRSKRRHYVQTAVFSPDGKYIFYINDDQTLKLVNTQDGSEVRTFSGHASAVTTIAFSSDGSYLLSGGYDKTIKLWDVVSGRELQSFGGDWQEDDPVGNMIEAVSFSFDRKYVLSGGWDNTLKLWDVATGRKINTFMGHSYPIPSIAISQNNRYLLAGEKLWDVISGSAIKSIDAYKETLTSVSYCRNGMYALTGSGRGTAKLWNVETGSEVYTLKGHLGFIWSLAFSKDSKLILTGGGVHSSIAKSGDRDTNLRLWDVASGRNIRTFYGHKDTINSVAFSPDGKYALSGSGEYSTGFDLLFKSADNSIRLWDLASGREVRQFLGNSNGVLSVAFSPDARYIVSGGYDKIIKLWDATSGREIRTLTGHSDDIRSIAFTPDGRLVLSGSNDKTIKLWDVASGREISTFMGHHGSVLSVAVSLDGKYVYSGSTDGSTRKWDISTGKEIAQFISFTDGEWITITPDGYYNSSPYGDKHLNVRIGNNVYGIENYREAFFRPDLVKITLSGGSLKGYRNIADVKQPPQVEIVNTPMTVAGDELTVRLKLSDAGGGIGDVRLYLNGSAIMLDNSRGLKVVEKKTKQGITRNYKIRLARGDNIIRAIAFNAENTMQSNPAEQTVTATFTPTAKPTLHALVIGVNEFKNPKLRLQYAVPDADLFTETLRKGASELFGKINIVRLTTPEKTTSENIVSELKKMRSINPEDLFILFVASHGTVDDGEYFLITSNVGSTSTAKLKTDALSQDKIKELIANIPATKKVIVLDTCNAGQMGDAIQVAMLTRGMSEDTAFKILSRAVGSTILSSATSTQEALEGYQGHGLFTWVLAEGMKGKADKGKTGYIKTTDLVDYVESEVPEIAEKHFKRKQYPTTAVSGQGFPIGKTGQ